MISDSQREIFLETVWSYYHEHGRHNLPWRLPEANSDFDPYKIMVSEIMLQQTQVTRVIPKYEAFLKRFPSVQVLAQAELGDVLRAWQGLGYNRRAKFLRQAAGNIAELDGFPTAHTELVKLPGIGPNTAGAILTYAYNQPNIFVETNVRTVYIHHFLHDRDDVDDKEIRRLLGETLDHENPREFYWALMDYGSHLKITVGNLNKVSKHYAKQSAFNGSRRQIRGAVLRMLGSGMQTLPDLRRTITDKRLESVLGDLVSEGLIRVKHGAYTL